MSTSWAPTRTHHWVRAQPPGYGGRAILRGCPNLTIVDPCDSVDIGASGAGAGSIPGDRRTCAYSGHVPTVLDEYDYHFELGKADRAAHRPGTL
jgi:transketolase C-terminal domain/subunit